jgi:hypothetical protein
VGEQFLLGAAAQNIKRLVRFLSRSPALQTVAGSHGPPSTCTSAFDIPRVPACAIPPAPASVIGASHGRKKEGIPAF